MTFFESLDKVSQENIRVFVKGVIGSLRDSFQSDLESFEVFAARREAEMQEEVARERQRFAGGFHTLIEEMNDG